MGEDKLKVCPFCGSRDVEFTDEWDEDGTRCMTVICNNCGTMIRPRELPVDDNGDLQEPGETLYDELEEKVRETWNTRDSSVDISKGILELSDNLISTFKTLGNLNIPKEIITNITKLDSDVAKLKDQLKRESVELKEKSKRRNASSPDACDELNAVPVVDCDPPAAFSECTPESEGVYERPVEDNIGIDAILQTMREDPSSVTVEHVGNAEGSTSIRQGWVEGSIVIPRESQHLAGSASPSPSVGYSGEEVLTAPCRPSARSVVSDCVSRVETSPHPCSSAGCDTPGAIPEMPF